MPSNPTPLASPHSPTTPQPGPTQSGYAAPEFETLALSNWWKPAYKWALRNRVPEEQIAIINLTQLHDSSVAFGTVVSFLGLAHSAELLGDWQETESATSPLYWISQAVIRDPEILRQYTPLNIRKSAAAEFKGDLTQKYLAALIAELPASCEPAETDWLNTMKLWLMVHAMKRARLGNVRDNLIRNVSTQLRLACKSDGNWRNIFQQLRPQSRDFDGISAGIRRRAQDLLEDGRQTSLSSSERALFHAIIDIDSGKESRDTKNQQETTLIPFVWPHSDGAQPPTPVEQIETYDEESEGKSHKWAQSPTTDGGDLIESDSDSAKSYTHQAIQGSGLLLQCIEDLQYLPYSWSRLNPTETATLEKWVELGGESDQPASQYLTFITWTALHLGRSLKRTLSIKISTGIQPEWNFNPEQFKFFRTPPRRHPGWHPGSPLETEWISESSTQQTVNLPKQAHGFIEKRLQNMGTKPHTLGDLWNSKWGETPEKAFRKEINSILPRVTGGMLGSHLPQKTFTKSGDATFARLLGSHPQTSLPGACAYASWPSSEVAPYLQLSKSDARDDDNAMGSLLDPIENLLCAAIKDAAAKVEQLRIHDDIVSCHNAYVAYLVVALIAATAARPNRDPFERLSHFDFDEAFVYISDKVSGNLRQGRLVPLPIELCDMLRDDYASHLRMLSRKLPHFGQPIQKLLSGNSTAPLPYFFLLTQDGKDWKSVSETEIANLAIFDWPLPLNHFRHRLAKQLRKRGADPEVIDSLMGHAEAGTATHGDYSLRVWEGDIQEIRPAIQSIYSSLGFVRIKPVHMVSTAPEPEKSSPITSRPFGAALREKERRTSLRTVIEGAKDQIANFMEKRSLSELSEQEIDTLSRKLLFKSDGMPHPRGQIKYRVFIKLIEREWRTKGKRVKLSKRYQTIPEDPSAFTENAPGAMSVYQKLKEFSESISSSRCNKRSFNDAAILGAFLLCVDSRIANSDLLDDVLHARNFRLVSINAKLHLEHSKNLPNRRIEYPVQRYPISERTGRYLDRVLSSKKVVTGIALPQDLSGCTHFLGMDSSVTPSSMLATITKAIDQVNVMTLPGIASGYLSGRVESYSLSWRDWARLELGYPISIPTDESIGVDSDSNSVVPSISVIAYFPQPVNIETSIMLEGARELLEKVSRVILDDNSSDLGYSTRGRNKSFQLIQSLIASHATTVSTSIQLLCRWLNSLLFRKKRGRYISRATIDRYMSAVKDGFTECSYKMDILIADSEEITELYTQILEFKKVKDLKYVGARLGDFHRWARKEHSIEDPDWGDLPEMASTLHVSPLFISESEYLNALRLLDNSGRDKEDIYFAQGLLFFCYRFGMRGNEAAGLTRSDLQMDGGPIVVAIQNNKHRKLKTATSRRQVPLLFRLTGEEQTILHGLLTRHEVRHGDNTALPLFGEKEVNEQQINRVKRLAIEAIKHATGNTSSNLHHARHSFANVIWSLLTCGRLHINSDIDNAKEIIEISLLGRTGETRRKVWALSRLLGHGRRETTARNYLHFLADFCEKNIGIQNDCDPDTFSHVITIEKFDRLAQLDTSLLASLAKKNDWPTYGDILKLMRLASRGQPISEAAAALNLSDGVGEQLQKLLDLLGRKINLSRSKLTDTDTSTSPYLRLLRRVRESTWDRLIEKAELLESNANLQPVAQIGVQNIADMIGATRQILLWKESHFRLLASFIEFTGLQPEDYRVIRTNRSDQHLDNLLADFDFKYFVESDQPKAHRLQVDSATFENGKYVVSRRCAFTINENRRITIRRSTDLLVAFCAFALASNAKPPV